MSATCGAHVHQSQAQADACRERRQHLNRCRCCGPHKASHYVCGYCKRHCKGGKHA